MNSELSLVELHDLEMQIVNGMTSSLPLLYEGKLLSWRKEQRPTETVTGNKVSQYMYALTTLNDTLISINLETVLRTI